jgi:aldose 1-epimerase
MKIFTSILNLRIGFNASTLSAGDDGQLQTLQQRNNRLEAGVRGAEAIRAIKRLQYAYGHYVKPGLAMKKLMLPAILSLLWLSFTHAQSAKPAPQPANFSAQKIVVEGIPVVRLADSKRGIEASILPSIGNMAFELKVHGKNILYFPDVKLSDFHKKPIQCGIPFLAPWANRLDETAFWANGKKYTFNLGLGNIHTDGRSLPIHGLLSNAAWQVTEVGSDEKSAHVTCKFEFWKQPDLMAQWPFAHEYEMTYRLADGALEVKTTVMNLSAEAMPIVLGFHPYYRIPDIPRDEWVLRMPAAKAVIADERRIPTGEYKPNELPNPLPLKGRTLDDGFTNLEHNSTNQAVFSIESGSKKIELLFGQLYGCAVIWKPPSFPGRSSDFICIEPMAGPTNATNLKDSKAILGLQTVPSNKKWSESFWIRPEGF